MEDVQVALHIYSVLYNKCNRVENRVALGQAAFWSIGLFYYEPSL